MSPPPHDRRRLRLTKHHGAGNDFLVLMDLDDAFPIDAETARALCDRRYGIGADGIIRVRSGGGWADLGMELRNADGSQAEMSGNGIRCLAQAAVEEGLVAPPTFTVSTGAGIRTVEFHPGETPWSATASVDMGEVALGEDQPQQFDGRKARRVQVGNPHLVLFGPDSSAVDVAELGARLQDVHAGGINVEFVSPGPVPDSLDLRVWERGVGETEACGTGSVAAAAAARSWGLVGDAVEVRNPGGTLQVAFGDRVRLSGPVRMVAKVRVDMAAIASVPRP